MKKHSLVKAKAYSRAVGRASRPRQSLWKRLNQAREISLIPFGHTKFVLLFVFLISSSILFATPWLFHTYIPNPAYRQCNPTPLEIQAHLPCGDPFTNLWDANDPNANGDEFNLRLASRAAPGANCGNIVNDCILLNPNSTDYAIAVSKSPVDLSTIAGKEMLISNAWGWNSGLGLVSLKNWGWFLTRNATLPNGIQGHSYDPFHDNNVAMIEGEQFITATTFVGNVWIQKDEQVAIANQDSSFSSGSCGSSTVCFLQEFTTSFPAQNTAITSRVYLNMTGNTDNSRSCGYQLQGFGPGCSSLQIDQTHDGYSQSLPFLVFQGIRYYVGFYAQAGLAAQIFWNFDISPPLFNAMSISMTTPITPATVNPPPPTIDTGGFFGPLIRALNSLLQIFLASGIFFYQILQPLFKTIITGVSSLLSTFIAILFTVVKAILNAIGNAIGLGNLGDNLFSFLSNTAGFFTSLFATILGWIVNVITFFVKAASIISATLGNYWTDLTSFLGALLDFLGNLWTVLNQVFDLSFSLIFSGFILYLALEASRDIERFWNAYHTTSHILLLLFGLIWWFMVAVIINQIIIPISNIVIAMATSEEAARPNIEVAGTGGG